jgi:hypothetical protein
MKKIISVIVMLTMTALFNTAKAETGEFVTNENNSIDPVMGITIKFNSDGSWKSIKSVGSVGLYFTDTNSQNRALETAEMEAMAGITRYMEQTLNSGRGIDEVANMVANKKTQGKLQEIEASQEEIRTFTKNIVNSSSNILTGVIPIDQIIDRDKMEVRVTVGISEKYMEAAAEVREGMAQNIAKGRTAERSRNKDTSTGKGASNGSSDAGDSSDGLGNFLERKGGVIHRRSPSYDDF